MSPQVRSLIVAILERAYRDLATGPTGNGHDVSSQDYRDARGFVGSAWFSTLCDALDINPEKAKQSFLQEAC